MARIGERPVGAGGNAKQVDLGAVTKALPKAEVVVAKPVTKAWTAPAPVASVPPAMPALLEDDRRAFGTSFAFYGKVVATFNQASSELARATASLNDQIAKEAAAKPKSTGVGAWVSSFTDRFADASPEIVAARTYLAGAQATFARANQAMQESRDNLRMMVRSRVGYADPQMTFLINRAEDADRGASAAAGARAYLDDLKEFGSQLPSQMRPDDYRYYQRAAGRLSDNIQRLNQMLDRVVPSYPKIPMLGSVEKGQTVTAEALAPLVATAEIYMQTCAKSDRAHYETRTEAVLKHIEATVPATVLTP